jgi:hypothetical protein
MLSRRRMLIHSHATAGRARPHAAYPLTGHPLLSLSPARSFLFPPRPTLPPATPPASAVATRHPAPSSPPRRPLPSPPATPRPARHPAPALAARHPAGVCPRRPPVPPHPARPGSACPAPSSPSSPRLGLLLRARAHSLQVRLVSIYS